ncbi:hypothetical protein TeGR_g12988 [Tetraparma gracilis]|uniref:Uncharacterized protein n=1 Tax=Tetraparma gracilis TaxID=2962635 RepID=A0ABQ6MLV5_9STRA|nr:hypothetical protein TeGR_g12988 [Tetraparma gracilis]
MNNNFLAYAELYYGADPCLVYFKSTLNDALENKDLNSDHGFVVEFDAPEHYLNYHTLLLFKQHLADRAADYPMRFIVNSRALHWEEVEPVHDILSERHGVLSVYMLWRTGLFNKYEVVAVHVHQDFPCRALMRDFLDGRVFGGHYDSFRDALLGLGDDNEPADINETGTAELRALGFQLGYNTHESVDRNGDPLPHNVATVRPIMEYKRSLDGPNAFFNTQLLPHPLSLWDADPAAVLAYLKRQSFLYRERDRAAREAAEGAERAARRAERDAAEGRARRAKEALLRELDEEDWEGGGGRGGEGGEGGGGQEQRRKQEQEQEPGALIM